MTTSRTAATPGAFPQTGTNRSLGEMKTELADYTGGKVRPDIQVKARNSIHRSIRRFNAFPWKFNRKIATFDLSAGAAGDSELALGSFSPSAVDFRTPRNILLRDSSGKTREGVEWVDWAEWKKFLPDQSTTASFPTLYTVDNSHERGVLILDPPLVVGSSLTWPTLELNYHRWIVMPSGDSTKFNVPQDFEDAIFELAYVDFIRKVEGFNRAPSYERTAQLVLDSMSHHRDYEDF